MSPLYLVLLLLIVVGHSWKTNRKPRVYGDKLPRRVLTPSSRQVQRKIVVYHNFFRTHVHPAAADMLSMTWHKGAALSAQRWADQCQLLTHDNLSGRWIDSYGSCGQNIFISTHQVPWFFAIKTWFLERHNFTYDGDNSLIEVGHYTQLVWASTHKVGCGFAECQRNSGKKYFSYVCNYCPIGNYLEKLSRPYKKGKACSGCPGHCKLGKLCTNSCPAADLWANCGELYNTWPQWLCRTDHTRQGRERRDNCKATCTCEGKIK
ncbi:cysteine-rich secretory protein 2-like [Macrosteles quadrilineatus]|uniref:cysteine-rich secretory protein 2-like n=1 Tax=Macrosteles quadrilineatus TaxID=74068 RepID=UPI0023E0B979|nr:cysteine-rich secretory protein 2-like [Macrosteles quadrilineatus]